MHNFFDLAIYDLVQNVKIAALVPRCLSASINDCGSLGRAPAPSGLVFCVQVHCSRETKAPQPQGRQALFSLLHSDTRLYHGGILHELTCLVVLSRRDTHFIWHTRQLWRSRELEPSASLPKAPLIPVHLGFMTPCPNGHIIGLTTSIDNQHVCILNYIYPGSLLSIPTLYFCIW